MSKILYFFLILAFSSYLLAPSIYARTTPEDIVNAQKESYQQSIKKYSAENKQKLDMWDKKIEIFNDQKSAELEHIMQTQGVILDEFIRRNEVAEKTITDGKTRNLSDPIENARYWLTYAHEAVAYQAAKVYVFNPTGEVSINQNILSTINIMQSDLNILKGKVQKSQTIMEELITKNEL
jgi:hypothetical protein